MRRAAFSRRPATARPAAIFPAALAAVFLLAGVAKAGAPVQQDTLSVPEVLRRQNARLDSLLLPESGRLDTTGVDSLLQTLDQGGYDSLKRFDRAVRRERGTRFSFNPVGFMAYNRVEGQRFGARAGVRTGMWLRGDAMAGYAVSSHRWSGMGVLTLGRKPNGPSLTVEGGDRIVPFGPNRIEYGNGFLSLLAGQDRQDYLRQRGGSIEIRAVRRRSFRGAVSAFHWEELSVPAETDAHLFGGGTPMEDPNPAIDRGRTRGATAGGSVTLKGDLASVEGLVGVAGGALGGDFDYSWQTARVTVRPVFPDGGVLSLSVEGARTGGAPPIQSRVYLGGEGNLRGYDRLQFVGTRRLSARIEYETGIDILARTRVPVVEDLHLQFIPFADLGTTWGAVGGTERTRAALEGKLRSSFGIGIRRDLWLPGIQAIRLDVIRRTDGSSGPWGFWFRIMPFHEEQSAE